MNLSTKQNHNTTLSKMAEVILGEGSAAAKLRNRRNQLMKDANSNSLTNLSSNGNFSSSGGFSSNLSGNLSSFSNNLLNPREFARNASMSRKNKQQHPRENNNSTQQLQSNSASSLTKTVSHEDSFRNLNETFSREDIEMAKLSQGGPALHYLHPSTTIEVSRVILENVCRFMLEKSSTEGAYA